MTTLADEFLADLEDDEEDVIDEMEFDAAQSSGFKSEPGDVKTEPEVKMENVQSIDDIDSVTNLMQSSEFHDYMRDIKERVGENPKPWFGLIEQNPEYLLVVKANELCSKIDDEIAVVHKFVQDMYAARFPELPETIPEPSIYLKTVAILGNDIEAGIKKLGDVLSAQTILIVTVTASTTSGVKIEEEKLGPLRRGCEVGTQLCDAREVILEFVESRMEFIAPNVCRIVGPGIAAKITAQAGGMTALTKMPACNIMLLGKEKKSLQGFSKLNMLPNTGFVFYAKLVQDLPPEFRKKAAKLVASKVTLAARVDCFHESEDGSVGKNLLEQIYEKFDKWQEPPPCKQTKALPVPLEAPRKKRGGRRARKMKERMGITDMRKLANRVNFGEIEDDVNQMNIGEGLGALNAKGGSSGKVRTVAVDKKTQVRISKALQQKLARNNAAMNSSGLASVFPSGGRTTTGGRDNVNGMASSVAFTPLKGLEIINPNACEKREQSNKYFSDESGFTSIKPKI